ncbi:uncharacterized protein C6orf136 homolog [Salarias fasciatus]|uniref:Uncharacterized protein n=1 Tax=Salarias fasciatus TaxID=181472 RepID=A0A672FRL8_SALFA|nr:uncharacterized protein C6orf136 homolog [Salarias fasciatus]
MAVSRGGVAFWVGCVRGRGGRPPLRRSSWTGGQVLEGPDPGPTRPLSSAVWALAPPNSLRYQTLRQPALCRPPAPPGRPRPRGRAGPEDEWQDSLSVCVLLRPGDGAGAGLHTLLEIPLFPEGRPPDPDPDPDLSFPMTTVDGCRPDDISVETLRTGAAAGSFRSLFQAERCPAPYVRGSTFYCFHCPAPRPGWDQNLPLNPENPRPRPASASLCGPAGPAPGGRAERDRDGEQNLELMFERLRLELPGFFMSNHDYSMYSPDLEFINGLLNVRTRGRLLYQLTLSLWRLVCLCYYAEARLDVLKLTKHPEDGSVRARWRIRGLPFHCLLLRFYRKDKSHLYRSYDAFSTFYVGQDGLIHCHRVDKVMPAPPPALPRVTSLLAGALVALGVQEPRPALNLLPLLLSSAPGPRPAVLTAAQQEPTARDKGADEEPGPRCSPQ